MSLLQKSMPVTCLACSLLRPHITYSEKTSGHCCWVSLRSLGSLVLSGSFTTFQRKIRMESTNRWLDLDDFPTKWYSAADCTDLVSLPFPSCLAHFCGLCYYPSPVVAANFLLCP